jgi:hypothetical protein
MLSSADILFTFPSFDMRAISSLESNVDILVTFIKSNVVVWFKTHTMVTDPLYNKTDIESLHDISTTQRENLNLKQFSRILSVNAYYPAIV